MICYYLIIECKKKIGKKCWFIEWLIHYFLLYFVCHQYVRILRFSHTIPKSPQGIKWEDCWPCRDGADGLPVDGDQLVQHDVGAGEDAVWVEEGVQKVNGEEAQVSQALQQALHAGVTDLRHLAGVHHLAKADVDIVTVQAGVGPVSVWFRALLTVMMNAFSYISWLT